MLTPAATKENDHSMELSSNNSMVYTKKLYCIIKGPAQVVTVLDCFVGKISMLYKDQLK